MNDILQIANYVQQQGELGRKQGMQNRLQELAPKALAGDYNATAQAYALDPQTAQAYEKGADRIGTQVYNVASAIKRYMGSGQEASAQKIYEQFAGSPAVQARFPGMSPLWNRNEVMPVVDSIMAQTAGSQSASGNPTGYREFEMTAQAAGLQPGTPEYQEAAKIKLGAVGRAATGGFGFTEIVGADGRKRLARQNPRTGAVEVYDEATGDFSPLGGGGALNPGTPTQAAPVVPAQAGGNARIAIDGVPQEQQQRMANVVSMMQQSGYPAEQIDSWVASQLSQPRAASPQQFSQVAATPTANPGLGVSRSPEEQAALTTAATEQAKDAAALASYDAMTAKVANREGAVARAKNEATGGGKPLPPAAMNQLLDVEDSLSTAGSLSSLIKKHADRMVSGNLQVSPTNALGARFRTAIGMTNDNDVNLNEFQADKTRIINESLRLNKGVQTEGDAQRAVQELMASNDPATAARSLRRLSELNRRAVELQVRKRELIRRNYGQDASGNRLPSAPSPDGGGVDDLLSKYGIR